MVLCILAYAGHRPVPDDARLLQTPVLIVIRLAAQMTQQSEFSKVSDVSGVPILHVDFPDTLSITSLHGNYRSCILSIVQWRSYGHNLHTSKVDDLLRCLGQRIRDLRKQRGWSQTAASEHIGVHWTYLGHLERAEKPGVSVMSIARIANAFGVTLADMFAGLEQGEALNPTGKPFRQPDTLIRVGKNAIKIEKLIKELRLERAALKETVRALKQITGPPGSSGSLQPSPKRQRSSNSKKR